MGKSGPLPPSSSKWSHLIKMKILFLSTLADLLIAEIQDQLSPEQLSHIEFYDEFEVSLAEADLIFMDYSLNDFKELFFDVLKYKEKVAILLSENDYDQINQILYKTGVHHLFSVSENAEQLNYISDMVSFILGWKRDVSCLSLMPNPSSISTTQLISSKDIDQSILSLLEGHELSDCFDGLPSIISNILDEVLSNALFKAPVDSKGNFLYRSRDRSNPVAMFPGKEVEAKIYSDSKQVIISVRDFYGSLTENNLFDYPPDTNEERQAGMRLGMYLIFRYGHKYYINVTRNIFCENIVVIEKSRRYKNYELREKSFHFFSNKEGAR
jgi:hypothetical protein